MSILVENLVKRFGGAAVLSELSFSAEAGEFFVVLGPSGCGKSTLLRLIAGLEESDGGRIALEGHDVSAPGLHVPPEARRVGVVFQSYALWPHMSVADNVAFPMEGAGRSKADLVEDVARHLATVSLEDLAARRPAELSGGQRQRVALARCLASGARTILMDEPLANLDPHLRGRMEEELVRVHDEAGATTLYITHDQREAMALASRVAVMQAGRFEQIAPPEEVHDRPASEAVARFIGRAAVVNGVVEGGRVRLGPLLADAVQPEEDGGPVRAVVRPRDVRLGDGDEATTGRVTSVAYRGGAWEGRVAVEGLDEALPVTAPARLRIGERLPVSLGAVWTLP
jgi:iron(III) transport system ATP-binding protein